MSQNDFLVRINKVNKKFKVLLLLLQSIVLLIFGVVIYYYLLLIPGNIFSASNLVLVLRVFKEIIIFALAMILYFLIFQSVKRGNSAVSAKIYIIVFLSNIATLFGIDPAFILDPNYFYNHIISAFSQPFDLIFGVTFLVFIVSCLLILGFLRRGSLELLFTLLIIMYLNLIFLGLFTQFFELREISNLELTNINSIIAIFLSRGILFFVISFILVELGQVYAFFYSYAKPLSNRLERLIRQLKRVESISERESAESRIRSIEGMKFTEILSPLAKSIIRDAFEGYAFLGEGTSIFVSAKLKSYVERMREKMSNYFESISGVLAAPKVSTIIVSLITTFLMKIGMGLLVVIGSAYISLFILNRLGGGSIIEMKRIEAYVYVNIAIISLIYVLVSVLSYRLKTVRKENIKELS